MGRVLGLDVGDKRIGVAVSDETRLIASPYCVRLLCRWKVLLLFIPIR